MHSIVTPLGIVTIKYIDINTFIDTDWQFKKLLKSLFVYYLQTRYNKIKNM